MELMLPAPWDLEYDPTLQQRVKEAGAKWNPNTKCWEILEPTEENMEEFASYV